MSIADVRADPEGNAIENSLTLGRVPNYLQTTYDFRNHMKQAVLGLLAAVFGLGGNSICLCLEEGHGGGRASSDATEETAPHSHHDSQPAPDSGHDRSSPPGHDHSDRQDDDCACPPVAALADCRATGIETTVLGPSRSGPILPIAIVSLLDFRCLAPMQGPSPPGAGPPFHDGSIPLYLSHRSLRI